MGRYWLVLVVLGQYNLVLLGIKWNCVSTRLLCLYVLKEVEIWSDVTIAGRRRTRKDRATQPIGPWTAEMSNLAQLGFSGLQFNSKQTQKRKSRGLNILKYSQMMLK